MSTPRLRRTAAGYARGVYVLLLAAAGVLYGLGIVASVTGLGSAQLLYISGVSLSVAVASVAFAATLGAKYLNVGPGGGRR